MKAKYSLQARIFMGLEGFYSIRVVLIVEMHIFMKVGLLMDYLKVMEEKFSKMGRFMKETLGLDSKMVQDPESRWKQIMRMTTKELK